MIEDIFRTPIYSTQLEIDNDKLWQDCLKVKRKYTKGNLVSNRGGYQSGQLLGYTGTESFRTLANTIAKHAGDFSKQIDLEIEKLKDLWFNVNYYKDYNLAHDHFDAYNKLSGVYYVKAPKDCGKIILYHPGKYVEHSWGVKTPKGRHNEWTASIWRFQAKPGKLMIFPSWLEHSVEHNLSKSPRVSFSFNIV